MTFLENYLTWACVNESPTSYHVWSGLSLASHLVGRRIWTDMELFKVWPQMYVVLAGPPGVAKSTAMDVAKDIVKEHFRGIAIASDAITKEAVTQLMALTIEKEGAKARCIQKYQIDGRNETFSQLSVFSDELVSILTCGGNPTGMIDFMTELFSGKDYRETTKNKGDNEIKNPYLSILACCTVATLKQLVQSKVVSGGMSRRCIFVVEQKNERPVARIRRTSDQMVAKQRLLTLAERMRATSGQFCWTSEADEVYEAWYDENFYRAQNCSSEVLQHFLRTKPSYCIKVSMLLAVGQDPPQLVHTKETFERAVELVTGVETGASKLFDSQGRNELSAISADVETWLADQEQPVLRTKIYVRFFRECKDGNTGEIDRILDHLARQGVVEVMSSYNGSSAAVYVKYLKKGKI